MTTKIRFQFPEGTRPRAVSSFDAPRQPLSKRFKLAVIVPDDWEDDRLVWSGIQACVGGRLDAVVMVRHPQDAAARWGYWHWTLVRIYGESEEDEFMQEADKVLIVGPKSDPLLVYYRDLAKYYHKPVAWASPKGGRE